MTSLDVCFSSASRLACHRRYVLNVLQPPLPGRFCRQRTLWLHAIAVKALGYYAITLHNCDWLFSISLWPQLIQAVFIALRFKRSTRYNYWYYLHPPQLEHVLRLSTGAIEAIADELPATLSWLHSPPHPQQSDFLKRIIFQEHWGIFHPFCQNKPPRWGIRVSCWWRTILPNRHHSWWITLPPLSCKSIFSILIFNFFKKHEEDIILNHSLFKLERFFGYFYSSKIASIFFKVALKWVFLSTFLFKYGKFCVKT